MPPDFTHRADLTELMDKPCSYEEFRACVEDIAQINRLTLSYRPVLAFLERVIPTRAITTRPDLPIHILDVGFGYGDMLRRIHHWAAERKLPVLLTGIDLNPYAALAAREASANLPITWLTGDAFSLKQPVDFILSSLFTHHLPHAELVRFLAWMESIATRGWFINDLERQPLPAHLISLLAKLMRWHRFVQHDAPVSFRRAFRTADWQALLAEANIDGARTIPTFPARLCVERLK
jgi:SAM-dependent methyltransferase